MIEDNLDSNCKFGKKTEAFRSVQQDCPLKGASRLKPFQSLWVLGETVMQAKLDTPERKLILKFEILCIQYFNSTKATLLHSLPMRYIPHGFITN